MGIKKVTITDPAEIEDIIRQAEVCYVGIVDENNKPYVLPMNFGFENNTFYFHTALTGKKLKVWRNQPEVCISLDIMRKLHYQSESVACSFSMKYKSILAYAILEEITDMDEKKKGLNIIMRQYTGKDQYKYSEPAVNNVLVFKAKCHYISAHNKGYLD